MSIRFLMFSEAHLLAFNGDWAKSLVDLLDDKLTENLVKFFNSKEFKNYIEESPYAKRLLQFRDYINGYTKPLEIANFLRYTKFPESEETYQSIIQNFSVSLDTLEYTKMQLSKLKDLIDILEELLDNISRLPTEYKPRSSQAYKDFFSNMRCLDVMAHAIHAKTGADYNPSFIEEIKANKRKFYSNDEIARNTRFSKLINTAPVLKIVLQGFKYQYYIRTNNLTLNESRSFV